MTTNALTVTESLTKTTQRSSLDELVTARTKRSLLLVDVSGSMDHRTSEGLRKIDQLRTVVRDLLETHPVAGAAFATTSRSGAARRAWTAPSRSGAVRKRTTWSSSRTASPIARPRRSRKR